MFEISPGFVLPWAKVSAEIVQAAARLDDPVAKAGLPAFQLVLDNPTAPRVVLQDSTGCVAPLHKS